MELAEIHLAPADEESAIMGVMPQRRPAVAPSNDTALTISPSMQAAFALGLVGLVVAGPVGAITGALIGPAVRLAFESLRNSSAILN